jgi:CRISPR/Cas system-associated exonuclease Cas4 (RecB family)
VKEYKSKVGMIQELKTQAIQQKAIVIDYKTGMPNNKHLKQINQYTSALQELGYIEVKGYIFYTSTLKLERIN